MRELFLRDRAVVYLSHGSYGACPRPVSERYQPWQRELERVPVQLMRRLPELLACVERLLDALSAVLSLSRSR